MIEEEMEHPNTLTEDELNTAYAAGYNACHDGININSYPSGSILAQQWTAGWQHYDADYNPSYYSMSYFYDL